MNLIGGNETGVGESAGFRKGQQRDVIDTLHELLRFGDGLYPTSYKELSTMMGINLKCIRRAVNDKRCPFNHYTIRSCKDVGVLLTLNRVDDLEAYWYTGQFGGYQDVKLVRRDGKVITKDILNSNSSTNKAEFDESEIPY